MEIAFVLSDLSSAGGIERVTSVLAKVFTEKGHHNITIVSLFQTRKDIIYDFPQNVKVEFITSDNYLSKKVGGFTRGLMFLKVCYKVKAFFKRSSYDFIIGQGFPVNLTLWLAGLSKKTIACEHVHYNYYGSVIRKCRLFIYKRCLQVVVLTEQDKSNYSGLLDNISFIPNAVSFCNEESEERVSSLNEKRIISVGRLEEQKGYDLLLRVSVSIFKQFPDWKLYIYGAGRLEKELIKLRDELGLRNNVNFKGLTNNIREEYLNSSLYVLPSRFEGFGIVLVEAAFCGLPIIAFDCPTGPRDILKNGGGILLPPNNLELLENAVIALLGDKEERLKYGLQGPNIAMRYTPSKIYEEWHYLFKKLT